MWKLRNDLCFLEDWLERHDNASLQDCWSFTEIGGPLSSQQEGLSEKMYKQDKFGSKQNFVASIWLQPIHYLKARRRIKKICLETTSH